jgi:PKD repeat protein
MLNIRYIGLILILIFESCKTIDDPVITIEDPVFRVVGTVNNQPLEIQAGIDNYIMETSYTYDIEKGVFDFKGSLQQSGCVNCPSSLFITIRNYTQSPVDQSVVIDSAFVTDYYSIRTSDDSPTSFKLNFQGQNFGNAATHFWNFGDGNSGSDEDEEYIYNHPGEYTVLYKAAYAGGCVDSIVNTFQIGIPGAICRANFAPVITGNIVTIENYAVGVSPLIYAWDFGDGMISNDFQPVHTYTTPGIYNIRLLVTDAQQHIATFNRKVIILPTSDCIASMFYPVLTPIPNPAGLSTVTITYTDENGTEFSSQNNTSTVQDFFKIESIEPYADNPLGERVIKLKTGFRCRLYDASHTNFVDLNIPEAVIGVAFK